MLRKVIYSAPNQRDESEFRINRVKLDSRLLLVVQELRICRVECPHYMNTKGPTQRPLEEYSYM
jgi:hypothetical protein